MKEITYLELLEMIKEGNQPEQVIFSGKKYIYGGRQYWNGNNKLIKDIAPYCSESDLIHTKYFSYKEKNTLEKVSYQTIGTEYDHKKTVQDINEQIQKLGSKLNEVIDYLKEKESEEE